MITTAMVGCGYWGPNLLRNLRAAQGCTVKWACDLDHERTAHMKTLYPDVQITDDFETVVSDSEVDAIVIATPVRFHYDMARAALIAGKHVFVEKPMASSAAECVELNRLADEAGLTLMVGHTFVYASAVAMIRRIVESGELGAIRYMSARRLNLGLMQTDINVAWDLAPHDISIMLHVLNEKPASVACTGKSHVAKGVEDVTCMTIEFDQSAFGIIHSSWLDPNKVREMTFVGDEKMLVYNDLETSEKIRVYDKRVDRPKHFDDFAEFQYSYHYGDMYAPYFDEVEPLRAECEHFVQCIETGLTPRSSGRDGLEVVEILEASTLSLVRDGAKVDLAEARSAYATR